MTEMPIGRKDLYRHVLVSMLKGCAHKGFGKPNCLRGVQDNSTQQTVALC